MFGGEDEGTPGFPLVIGVANDEILAGALGPAQSIAGMKTNNDPTGFCLHGDRFAVVLVLVPVDSVDCGLKDSGGGFISFGFAKAEERNGGNDSCRSNHETWFFSAAFQADVFILPTSQMGLVGVSFFGSPSLNQRKSGSWCGDDTI